MRQKPGLMFGAMALLKKIISFLVAWSDQSWIRREKKSPL